MGGVPSKDDLKSAWHEYVRRVDDRNASERQINDALLRLDDMAPHSYITDLLHRAERQRSEDEAIEEAIFREQLWHERGEVALIEHLTLQLTEALDKPDLRVMERHYCEKMLRHLWGGPQ